MYVFRCHVISTDMFIGIVKLRTKGFYTNKYVCLNLECWFGSFYMYKWLWSNVEIRSMQRDRIKVITKLYFEG